MVISRRSRDLTAMPLFSRGFSLLSFVQSDMNRATARSSRNAAACACARPWVKPQAGVVKTRRKNRDGSLTIFRVETDHRGVVRKSETTIIPN